MSKVNINFNEGLKITIETESSTAKTQNEEEKKDKSNVENADLTNVKVEDITDTFIYEKRNIPRKSPSFWVQYIGRDRHHGALPAENANQNPNEVKAASNTNTRIPHRGMFGSHEREGSSGGGFEYEPSRNDFVRFVFLLVLLMLLVTAVVTLLGFKLPPFYQLLAGRMGYWIGLSACVALLVLSCVFPSECMRTAPCNYIGLFVTSLVCGVICAYFTVRYDAKGVFLAAVATFFVVLLCLILACTSFDFTKYLLFVIVISAAFSFVWLTYWVYTLVTKESLKPLHLGLLIAGTILECVMLTIELQMILGGKSVEMDEDDYAYAAFSVYTSIISIFLSLLQLMNFGDN